MNRMYIGYFRVYEVIQTVEIRVQMTGLSLFTNTKGLTTMKVMEATALQITPVGDRSSYVIRLD